MVTSRWGWLVVLLMLAGCESWEQLAADARIDGGSTSVDAGTNDAGADAGEADAGSDAGADAGVDAGVDAGSDAGSDAGVDAGFDAGVDLCALRVLTVSGAPLVPPLGPPVSLALHEAALPFPVTSFFVHAELMSADAGVTMSTTLSGGLNASGDSMVFPAGSLTFSISLAGSACPTGGRSYVVTVSSRDVLATNWVRELSIDAGAIDDAQLGTSIALSNDVVLLGAPREDPLLGDGGAVLGPDGGALRRSGRAYVFERTSDGGEWQRTATLAPPTPRWLGEFGTAVALAGDTAAVSEPEYGQVHLFRRTDAGWVLESSVRGGNTQFPADGFGNALALGAGHLVVGAPLEDNSSMGVGFGSDDENAPNSGAVYVFARGADAGWQQVEYLKPDAWSPNALFGAALAFDGARLVVGAPGEETNGVDVSPIRVGGQPLSGSGAVFIFERQGASWSQTVWAKAPNAGDNDAFGRSVALSGARVVVGAPLEQSALRAQPNNNAQPLAGAAYVLTVDAGTWAFTDYLKAAQPDMERFGESVGISGDVIAVGAPENSSMPLMMPMRGAAYLFTTTATSWVYRGQQLSPRATAGQRFGAVMVVGPNSFVSCSAGADPATQGACWERRFQAP